MRNDTDIPLAILFTFRCYGTWLHGDPRGSTDRNHNIYGTPFISESPQWRNYQRNLMQRDALLLNAQSRRSAETGVRETCEKRCWNIIAFNIRTNHVHSVIDVKGYDTKRAQASLKAGATKQMRDDGLWTVEQTPWAEKGSRRKLWNPASIEKAVDYVINGQGNDLPDLD